MAYQSVGRPRFFINVLEWLNVSKVGQYHSVFHTLPVAPIMPTSQEMLNEPSFQSGLLNEQSFQMLLGHNLNSSSSKLAFEYLDGQNFTNHGNFVNNSYPFATPDYNGWSLITFDGAGTDNWRVFWTGSGVMKVGSIVIGSYYDMPISPNLSLTMSREYGSTNEFTTYNGSSMSNTMNNSAPQWGDLGAWELGSSNPAFSKSGRRTWQLKFSYMDDGDLWGSNQSLATGEWGGVAYDNNGNQVLDDGDFHTGGNSPSTFNQELLSDNNFFSQVWQKTLGMTIPCIFQPDSSNSNPDQFAIVRGVSNSLKATQSAFNVYDISLSIEEVW